MISAAIGLTLAHHASGAVGGTQASPYQLSFALPGEGLKPRVSVLNGPARDDSSKTPINHVERTPNTELCCLTPAHVRPHRLVRVFSFGSNQLIHFGRFK